MLKAGGARFAVKLSASGDGVALREAANFSEVLDDIRKQIALCASSNDPLDCRPCCWSASRDRQDALRAAPRQLLATGLALFR